MHLAPLAHLLSPPSRKVKYRSRGRHVVVLACRSTKLYIFFEDLLPHRISEPSIKMTALSPPTQNLARLSFQVTRESAS